MTFLPQHAPAASEAQRCPSEPVDYDLHLGDMREVLAGFEPNSIDSVVTDPPYGLSFMGKGWDRGVPGVEFWQEALRVAKPGAHLLAFGGTRTYHRLMCAIEDAGWEIRDCIMWVYGSGFPKSLNIGKAIDKAAGAEREVVGQNPNTRPNSAGKQSNGMAAPWTVTNITAPATDAAKQWEGWGTALKPAWEPIIVARKPVEGTVAQNVLKHGTGGINIDGCRIEGEGWSRPGSNAVGGVYGDYQNDRPRTNNNGRWPANLIHDGSEEVVSLFPETTPSSCRPPSDKTPTGNGVTHGAMPGIASVRGHDDNGGSAARFFYCAKANKKDRNEGCEGNWHPTVKPTDLMRYCVKLVTPVGGVVLDPFMGSGSTGKAALLEGMNFIGVELDAEYAKIATARLSAAQTKRNSTC